MDATELARWTRFAARGGIGKCTATHDCVAEKAGDLMFLKDDEITVLMQLPEYEGQYLGYCEGVVGRFQGLHVHFHSKLKKPVMAKRSSLHSSKSPTPSVQSTTASPTDVNFRRASTSASASTPSHHPRRRVSSNPTTDDENSPKHPRSHSSTSTRSESVLHTPPVPRPSFDASKVVHHSADPQHIEQLPLISHQISKTPPPIRVSDPHPVPSPSPQPPPPPPLPIEDETPPAERTPRPPSPSTPPRTASPITSLHESPTQVSPPRTAVDKSFTDYDGEPSTRLSIALSDGEVGIGLSLLQDLVSGGDDDWSSTNSRYSTQSMLRTPNKDVDITQDMEDSPLDGGFEYGEDEDDDDDDEEKVVDQLQEMDADSTPQQKHVGVMQEPTSPTPSMSFLPNLHERKPSLVPSTMSKRSDEWEGASDIYDNYRYSRYSIASKASRHSQISSSTHPNPTTTIPPIPDSRPSLDGLILPHRDRKVSNESATSVYTQASKKSTPISPLATRTSFLSLSPVSPSSPPTPNGISLSHLPVTPLQEPRYLTRPTPLELQDRSPLLHTNFGSTLSSPIGGGPSPSPNSMRFSPGTASPTFFGSNGMASALRQRFEVDKPADPVQRGSTEEERKNENDGEGIGGKIVVEDDEELPSGLADDSHLHDEPSMSESLETSPQISTEQLLPALDHPSSPPPIVNPAQQELAPIPPPTTAPLPSPSSTLTDGGGLKPLGGTATPPPSSLSPSPSPSHLRPSLSELRGADGPGQPQRRSLFLPHPGAPRAPAASQGPMYIQPPSAGGPASFASTGFHQQPSQQPPHPPQLQSQSQSQQQLQTQPQQRPPTTFIDGVPAGSSIHITRILSQKGRSPPSGRGPPPTMYGRTEVDLANSTGPVLITFTLDPPTKPPATAPGGVVPTLSISMSYGQGQQQGMGGQGGGGGGVVRRPSPSPSQLSRGTSPASSLGGSLTSPTSPQSQSPSQSQYQPIIPTIGVQRTISVDSQGTNGSVVSPTGSVTSPTGSIGSVGSVGSGGGGPAPIPRANFFPKAGTARPRSRSFSGFNNSGADLALQQAMGSQDGGGKTPEKQNEVRRSASTLSLSAGKDKSFTPKASPLRNQHAPSPLSLPHNNVVVVPPLRSPSKAPPSPLSQTSFRAPSPQPPTTQTPNSSGNRPPPSNGLRTMTSRIGLAGVAGSTPSEASLSPTSPSSPPPTTTPSSRPSLRVKNSLPTISPTPPPPPASTTSHESTSPTPLKASLSLSRESPTTNSSEPLSFSSPQPPPVQQQSQQQQPLRHRQSLSIVSQRTRPSVDTETMSIHSGRSQVTSPPPTQMGRQNSLRSKLSMPNLRRNRSRQDETSSIHSQVEAELLQVQDMDFELVRPNIRLGESARASEDSGVLGRGESIEIRGGGGGGGEYSPGMLRPESPATLSLSSGQRSPGPGDSSFSISQTSVTTSIQHGGAGGPGGTGGSHGQGHGHGGHPTRARAVEAEQSVENHRQREQKWMNMISSIPPSQARKNKKVRKLLGEGVPSSVRYPVWCHLTDSKARGVPNVYLQLGKRDRVRIWAEMEGDVKRNFKDHPQLQTTQGPLLTLLQAFLTMVPDVHYSASLTMIAGHLLLVAPEEDAFWMFVQMMDSYLRPYFSSSNIQMEVDAALFSRALEVNDAVVAKKVLVDMSVSPGNLCRTWFSGLFVCTLPTDYINRVWDIFLFEGIPFLIRVGLAIIACCRRQILDCTSEEMLISILNRPSPTWLPSTTEGFITLALSFKVKDDDIRKQRIKMEAQVKRQTQQQQKPAPSGTSSISLPR
ncbi:hypothetical protein BDN72DRAFT_799449 [Pluteus cervinus]|uniref:Uncharacterized protein n=1 Tax=Pluteus cervinus TaxID=181527 RepID=A0ACD3APW4_9AGAR|nr:hypothetical protein BDN72DRAFT_799449 [Pluteus cervinus]